MPQQDDWYQRNRVPVAPAPAPITPSPQEDWYQRNRATPLPPAPPRPKPSPTANLNLAPRNTKSTFQRAREYWTKDLARQFGRNVSNVYSAGKRLSELPQGILSQSPLYQQNQAMQELSKPESERVANTAAAKQAFDETLNIEHPYKLARNVMSVADPTGTVADYMDLGESTYADIKNKNYGGAATNVALGALPAVLPIALTKGGKLAKVATKGIDESLLGGKKIGVVPDVEIPKRNPNLTSQGKPFWDFENMSSGPGNVDVVKPPEMHGPPRTLGVTERKSSRFSLKPEGDRTVPVVMNKNGSVNLKARIGTINKRGKNIVYITPEVEQAIRTKKIANSLLESSDHLAGDPLLGTVPNRVRPEVPNVAALREASGGEASVGKGGQRTVVGQKRGKLEFVDEAVYEKQRAEAQAIEKANAEARESRTKAAKQEAERNEKQKAAREKGDTVESIIEEKLKNHPEVKKNPTLMSAIKAIPDRIRQSTLYKEIYEPLAVGGLTKLERLGEGGKRLAKELRDVDTLADSYFGPKSLQVQTAMSKLSKAEQKQVTTLLEGKEHAVNVQNPKVLEAFSNLRRDLDESGSHAQRADVRMKNKKGENVPFEKIEKDYFPHQYDEALYKNPEELRARLLAAGNSIAEVDAMMKNITEKGERFSSAQHTRDFNLPGYREDLGVVEKHHREMSRAIARAERLGPMDIADPNSRLHKLIKETSDPVEAMEIVKDYLGRNEVKNKSRKYKLYNNIVRAQAATKLSQFFITNTGDLAAIASKNGYWNTTKAIGKFMKNPWNAVDDSTRMGAQASLRKGLLSEVEKENLLGRATMGSNASDKVMRTLGSLSGRMETERLFNLAKKDPRQLPKLQSYIDGDVNAVIKQDKLTDAQLYFGGARGAEMTSGKPNALTLSKAFVAENPSFRLPLLFKRFAFMNLKNMIDTVKLEPTVAKKAIKAAKVVAAYEVMGEGIGDVKSIIRGLVTGNIEKEFNERGDYIGIDPVLDRLMANALQSSLFGLFGDFGENVVHSYGGKLTGWAGGPIASDADEILKASVDFVAPPEGKRRTQSFEKMAVRRVPIFGEGLAKKFYGEDKPFNWDRFGNKAGNKFSESIRTR